MSRLRVASRLAGGVLLATSLVPWVLAGTASAAVTVYLAAKWDGVSSTSTSVERASCDYKELAGMSHAGVGWHFVLPGGSGLSTFSASFAKAGAITVSTTDGPKGAIVQDGKGAVVYTPGNDTLKSIRVFDLHPGRGTAETTANNSMQLSHICTGQQTSPVTTPATTPVTTTPVTTTPVTTTPVTTPVTTTPVTTTPVTGTPSTTTTTSQVSVLPTKIGQSPGGGGPSPAVSVLGTKIGLAFTGQSLPLKVVLLVSLALVLAGIALFMLPGGMSLERHRRRH